MKKFTDLVNENKVVEDNNKVLERVDVARLYEVANDLIVPIQEELSNGYDQEELDFLKKSLIDFINEINLDHLKQPMENLIETGTYGTDHLAKQDASLGEE
jgi:hypothetical protein